jgi:hypothetical protein
MANNIVRELIIEKILKALLYDNGVIEIVWDKSIEIIEVIHLSEMQKAVCKLGKGKKMPLHFTVHEFLQISDAARKHATSDEGITYSLAITVLIDNLAKKILFNFFMNVNKPKIPTKSFTNKEDAFLWLEQIQNDE